MDNSEVKQMVAAGFPDADIKVTGDGSHYEVVVVSEVFEGKSPVVQQKMVYATLGENITNGTLHALTIKAYTPEKWALASKLMVGSE